VHKNRITSYQNSREKGRVLLRKKKGEIYINGEQGKTKTRPLPKTESAHEPLHLTTNQNTPPLHWKIATQRPTTAPKQHL